MTALYWLLLAVMGVGVIGAVVPALPGAILILGAIIVWGLVNGFAGLGIPIAVTIVVLLANSLIDFLATYLGAKQAGASKWGQIGAIVGLLLGVFGLLPASLIGGPLLGLLIGPLLGAIIGEFLYRRDLKLAVRAGIGIVVGTLIGNLIEGLLALIAMIVFIATTWPQVMG
ncbi:DUF456 family protein [Leptolyngbya sp. NK1-12]|uniref:DUF456 family protein n=1 Tax=Leptolyngbya sp. NK1-12 TaxID=2547451 RepID=A0AA97AJA9_9CYAN|nr:DUF456 family protein [Leptolyngbya sp. NK1-12]